MSDIADAVGDAVLSDAGVDDATVLSVGDHLALIRASWHAEEAARGILQRSVVSARAGGASWAAIGVELGMSRQAAQQRFGGSTVAVTPAERWLGPVTAFDELAELEIAGRAGWHTVEAGLLEHRMVRTETQWEHRRILWRASLAAAESDGWIVGCRSFPWIYLIRDLGVPAEPSGV